MSCLAATILQKIHKVSTATTMVLPKRVKHKQVDILLVVNMFLIGFDSKTLNTIYVDKNLKYYGSIQASSGTNRILNEVKS